MSHVRVVLQTVENNTDAKMQKGKEVSQKKEDEDKALPESVEKTAGNILSKVKKVVRKEKGGKK